MPGLRKNPGCIRLGVDAGKIRDRFLELFFASAFLGTSISCMGDLGLCSPSHEMHERTTKTRNFQKRKSKLCSTEVGRFASNPQINKIHEKGNMGKCLECLSSCSYCFLFSGIYSITNLYIHIYTQRHMIAYILSTDVNIIELFNEKTRIFHVCKYIINMIHPSIT